MTSQVVAINDLVDTATNAHLLKYDSNYGRFKGDVAAGRRRPHGRRRAGQGLRRARPGQDPVGRCRGRHRHRVDGLLHQRPGRSGAPPRQRQEGDHQRAGHERGHDHRPRRERREVRPGEAPRDLQRLLHHQRPRAASQGAGGRVRPDQGPDDHDPLLHELAADPRPRRPEGPA